MNEPAEPLNRLEPCRCIRLLRREFGQQSDRSPNIRARNRELQRVATLPNQHMLRPRSIAQDRHRGRELTQLYA
jgi:hypothetical protein